MKRAEHTPDPRGPHRTIISVRCEPDATYITKSCGHVSPYAQHFHYEVGANIRCFSCGPRADAIAKAEGKQ